MGKRSDFPRIGKDRYLTPIEAVQPLIPYLRREPFTFAEPCAWDGRLAFHVETLTKGRGQWRMLSDIEPGKPYVGQKDALTLTEADVAGCDFIITNPPWSRNLLNPMIERFLQLRPTWLLFDADWAHTVQEYIAAKNGCKTVPELLRHCHHIVPIGRVKWFDHPGSKKGKENACWYYFDSRPANVTEFHAVAA